MSDWHPSDYMKRLLPDLTVEFQPVDPWLVSEVELLLEAGDYEGIRIDGQLLEDWHASVRFPGRHH